MGRFEKETGIKPYDWGKYWVRFGDAQKEAGFSPNQLQVAYSDEFLFEKIISLARKLNKFPTSREIRLEKINNSEFQIIPPLLVLLVPNSSFHLN